MASYLTRARQSGHSTVEMCVCRARASAEAVGGVTDPMGVSPGSYVAVHLADVSAAAATHLVQCVQAFSKVLHLHLRSALLCRSVVFGLVAFASFFLTSSAHHAGNSLYLVVKSMLSRHAMGLSLPHVALLYDFSEPAVPAGNWQSRCCDVCTAVKPFKA